MSSPSQLANDLMTISEYMCMAWAMNPDPDGDGWVSDELPPWSPTWRRFLTELTDDQCDLCYKTVFPQDEERCPSLIEMGDIALDNSHIIAIRDASLALHIRYRQTQTEALTTPVSAPIPDTHPAREIASSRQWRASQASGNLSEETPGNDVPLMTPRRIVFDVDFGDTNGDNDDNDDNESFHYYSDEDYEMSEDENTPRDPKRLMKCQRGLAIIEESMEKKIPLTEGMYLELSNLLQELSV
jgi:hypothetical protein